jgi:hypothetical protein
MTKIAGSGSGSISQKHGSEDPDPDPPQNVMDPEHCDLKYVFLSTRVPYQMLEDIHNYKIYAITDLHALLFIIPVQQCCGASRSRNQIYDLGLGHQLLCLSQT